MPLCLLLLNCLLSLLLPGSLPASLPVAYLSHALPISPPPPSLCLCQPLFFSLPYLLSYLPSCRAGISAIRRLRKTDNNRIARATGATVANRVEELEESHVGTGAGLFEVKKVGDEYFTFLTDCKEPKACTILLRGASKDILNEMERNLQVGGWHGKQQARAKWMNGMVHANCTARFP